MVRKKSCPFKGILDIDYNDPAIVFWFFGQQIPSKKKSIQSSAVSPPKEKDMKSEKLKRQKKIEEPVLENVSPTKKESLTHPLTAVADVPALTDLQIFITEAIITEGGQSCPFEKIYDYVSKRWKNIRRRDGSNYTTDCRRAIQANLRHNPHHIALFRRDKSKPGLNNWLLCYTLEDAAEASKESEKKDKVMTKETIKEKIEHIEKDVSEDEDLNTSTVSSIDNKENKGEEKSEDDLEDEDDEDDDIEEKELLKPKEKPKGSKIREEKAIEFSLPLSPSPSDIKTGDKKLTDLQVMICECINDNGGSCHFDLIVHHVTKNWNKIKTGNTDCKGAILQALTDSKNQRIFKRDTKKTGWWMISDPAYSTPVKEEENPFSRSSRAQSRKSKNMKQKKGKLKDKLSSPDISGEEEDFNPNLKNKESPMTELQVLVINSIDKQAGAASIDEINEYVSKFFESLKKKDGTPYVVDTKKLIQTNLTNNPNSKPFFKKENRKGVTMWTLSKRTQEFLDDYKKSHGDHLLELSDFKFAKEDTLEFELNPSSLQEITEKKEQEITENINSTMEDIEEEINDLEESDSEIMINPKIPELQLDEDKNQRKKTK